MKRIIKSTFVLLLITIYIITLFGCASKNKYVIDARDEKVSAQSNIKENQKKLDPFEGLSVDFDGVSPFCTISFNNSRCSETVQKNVEYSVDSEIVTTQGYFSIEEEVIVYAFLKNTYEKENEFVLSKNSKSYRVENVAQYITEIEDDMDLSKFKQEALDYKDSIIYMQQGSSLADWNIGEGSMIRTPYTFKSSNTPVMHTCFFSTLKMNAYDKFPQETDNFNRIDVTFSVSINANENEQEYKRYFAVTAKNIVKYPDGTIGWGKDDPSALNFEHNIDSASMESLINGNITSKKADYNVSEVSI